MLHIKIVRLLEYRTKKNLVVISVLAFWFPSWNSGFLWCMMLCLNLLSLFESILNKFARLVRGIPRVLRVSSLSILYNFPAVFCSFWDAETINSSWDTSKMYPGIQMNEWTNEWIIFPISFQIKSIYIYFIWSKYGK